MQLVLYMFSHTLSCTACGNNGQSRNTLVLCSEYHRIVLVTAGMQQVTQRSGQKAQVASVLLLTDGQANVRPSAKERILDAMRNHVSYNSM